MGTLVWGASAKDNAEPVRVEKAFPAIVAKGQFRRFPLRAGMAPVKGYELQGSLYQFSRCEGWTRFRSECAHGRELWGPLNAGTDISAQSLTRVLDTASWCFCGARSVSRRSYRRRLRQNSDSSPFRFNWTTLAIRCAPRMVQLIPRFFIRFAVSLSPLDSMVPRLRASGGALGIWLRQSTPVTTLDSTYSLSLYAIFVCEGGAEDIASRTARRCSGTYAIVDCCPNLFAVASSTRARQMEAVQLEHRTAELPDSAAYPVGSVTTHHELLHSFQRVLLAPLETRALPRTVSSLRHVHTHACPPVRTGHLPHSAIPDTLCRS